MLVKYQIRRMKMKLYEKNPYCNQYIAHQGYHFTDYDGRNIGRIIWINNIDGITIEKDED